MVDVKCPGCSASYSLSEKRIPAQGMDMRCPQCGQTFQVTRAPSSNDEPEDIKQTPPSPSRDIPHMGPRNRSLFGRGEHPDEAFHSPAVDELFGDTEMESDDDFGVIDMALPGNELAFDESLAQGDDLPIAAGDADLPIAAGDANLPVAARDLDLPVAANRAQRQPARSPLAPPRRSPPARLAKRDASSAGAPASGKPPHRAPVSPPRSAQTETGMSPFDDDEGIDLPVAASHEADLPVAAEWSPRRAGDADLPTAAHRNKKTIPRQRAETAPREPPRRPPTRATAPAVDADRLAAPVAASNRSRHDTPRAAKTTSGYDHAFHQRELDGGTLPLDASEFADLPLPAEDVDLPTRAAASDLPSAVDDADLPLPADHDLPLPARHSDLPQPADLDFPLPSDGDDGLPPLAEVPDASAFDPGFGEFELADDPGQRYSSSDLQAEPEPEPAPISEQRSPGQEAKLDPESDTFGDEFDLEGAAQRQQEQGDGGEDAPKVRLKRKPSTRRRAALIAVPLLALAGGMLYLTPLGPFGAHAIGDYINRDEYEAAMADLTRQSQERLGLDTAADARAALTRAQTMRREMPRYQPLTGYAAYLALWSNLRFGTGSQDMALGKQLLSSLQEGEDSSGKQLASIAQAAAGDDLGRALSRARAYASQLGDDQDALALAGEVALLAKQPKEALELFDKCFTAHPSALAAYGAARAHFALDEHASAQKSAEETLKLSKNHAGARTLLATVLWTQNNKDERPFKLVEEVVAKGPVRQAASRAELVLAYSLVGEIHLSRSHMTDAEQAFGEALKLDPQSQRALLGNGELLYHAGRFSEALARFEAAHRPDPQAEMPIIGKAKTKIALERPKDAKADLLTIVKTSKHPLVGYWLGRAEEALGNNEQAEKWYRQALKVGAAQADAVSAYVALADLLGSQGRNDEAAQVLSEAGDNLPRSVALHNARGDVALTAGRVDDAKREFLAALEIDPKFMPSRFRLAVTLRKSRDLDGAEAELKRVLDSDPEYPGLALERGLLFEERGDTERALSMYADALKKAPDDIDLKLRVGSTQVGSGHPKQAVPLLREVLNKRPRSAEVNYFLGRALLLLGDAKEALRYLQTAVRFDLNRAEYYLYTAWAANDAGQVSVASDAVDKALELNKELGDAYWQRAVVKQKYSRTRDALADLEIALAKNPSRYQAYATQAICYQDQSEYANAEASWRKAVEGDAKVAEWQFRLGKLLWDRGAREEAAKHLLAAVDLAKDSKRGIGWLWNAQWLLGEALRTSDPARAKLAYREFLRLASSDNAYRPDAERALATLEQR